MTLAETAFAEATLLAKAAFEEPVLAEAAFAKAVLCAVSSFTSRNY